MCHPTPPPWDSLLLRSRDCYFYNKAADQQVPEILSLLRHSLHAWLFTRVLEIWIQFLKLTQQMSLPTEPSLQILMAILCRVLTHHHKEELPLLVLYSYRCRTTLCCNSPKSPPWTPSTGRVRLGEGDWQILGPREHVLLLFTDISSLAQAWMHFSCPASLGTSWGETRPPLCD